MSHLSTDVWRSTEANPLLWLATGALAFLAHVTLLQVGVASYKAQLALAEADPPLETRIITSAFQAARREAPPPVALEATPVEAATPEALTAEILAPTAPESESLKGAEVPALSAAPVETLSATASEPLTAAPVAPAPESEPQVANTVAPQAAETTAMVSPAPAAIEPPTPQVGELITQSRPEPQDRLAAVVATQAPEPPRLSQPGVTPLAVAPIATAPPASPAPVTSPEPVETAALAPTVVAPAPVVAPSAEATPVVQPELQPDPQSNLAPLPDLATSLPPPPSGLEEDVAGVASANAPAQSAEEAQDTYAAVLNFLRSFDGGACFAALPVLAEDGSFRFETFAKSRADLTRFRQALEIETGTLPGTVMKPVSAPQCQVLPFVTAAARYPEFRLYFDLESREIESGQLLSGRLGNTLGGFVSLLLIDDEGVVQDLGRFLKFRPGYAGFDIPMTVKGAPVETQQLLMALSTKARLQTLATLSGQQAEDVFQKLALEILLQGGDEDVALVAFSVR